VLLDDIVNTSLRSLALGSSLRFLLSLNLTFARSFAIGGGEACTSTRTLALARG
jgi:hypothetical protein